MPEKKNGIPDLMLERYLLGELPSGEMEKMDDRFSRDRDLRERLEALKRSNSEILSEYKPEETVQTLQRKAHLENVRERFKVLDGKRSPFRHTAYLVPAGLAALLVLSLLPGYLLNRQGTVQVEDTRIKGLKPNLQVFLKKGTEPVKLKDGDTAREGDVIQLRYQSAGRKHGAIFSVDGNGNITMHYPAGGHSSGELNSKGKTSLKHAYELDDAPRFECFYFFSADNPFVLNKIFEAVKTAGPAGTAVRGLQLPGLHQETVALIKEEK